MLTVLKAALLVLGTSYSARALLITNPLRFSSWRLAPLMQSRQGQVSRREHVKTMFPTLVAGGLAFLKRRPAEAVVMDSSTNQQIFAAGQTMSVADARKRFEDARQSLTYLLDNYDEISKGGGDNIRRYLGTVGTSSGLYGITKVLKILQEEADDIVEYTENMSEFDFALRAADTDAYSANFVEFSAAKTKPEKFFEDARLGAERMQVYMDNMAAELK